MMNRKIKIPQVHMVKLILVILITVVLSIIMYRVRLNMNPGSQLELSQASGFYSDDIDVVVTNVPRGWKLYYTMDGSEPSTESEPYRVGDSIHISDASANPNRWCMLDNFSLSEYYTPSENIDKCVNLRVRAYDPKRGYQGEVSASYYIYDEKRQQAYTNIPTVSIMADPEDFFDGEKGIYCIGNDRELCNWEKGETVAGLVDIVKNDCPNNLELFDEACGGMETALRIRGNQSATSMMKAIGFTDSHGNNWVLRPASSLLTDAILFPILGERESFEAPVTQPVNVFLCGEYWGLYVLEQRIDENFVSKAYHIDKTNLTLAKNKETMYGETRVGKRYMGLREDVCVLNWSDEAAHRYMCDHFDMQNFIDYYTSEIYINDQDSSEIYNYVVFRENRGDIRWRYCLYDLDSTLMDPSWNGLTTGTKVRAAWTDNLLVHEWLNNLEFKYQFINTLLEMADKVFDIERIEPFIDRYYETIEPSIELQESRYPGFVDSDWDNSKVRDIDEIKDFFRERPGYIRAYVEDFF